MDHQHKAYKKNYNYEHYLVVRSGLGDKAQFGLIPLPTIPNWQ